MVCTGLDTGFAILVAGALARWCIDPVEPATRYEWQVQESGVVTQELATAYPELSVETHFADAMRVRVRACDSLECSEWAPWSGSEALPLELDGDGMVGGVEFNELRLMGPSGEQFNAFRRGFSKPLGLYP